MIATETITLGAFIREQRLSMTAEWTDSNPNMDDSAQMNHWKCKIRAGASGKGQRRTQMTLVFSQGYAHTGEPKLKDVLDCLASDSSSIENARSFEEWASDFGYDTDSRKAERTFKACERQGDLSATRQTRPQGENQHDRRSNDSGCHGAFSMRDDHQKSGTARRLGGSVGVDSVQPSSLNRHSRIAPISHYQEERRGAHR